MAGCDIYVRSILHFSSHRGNFASGSSKSQLISLIISYREIKHVDLSQQTFSKNQAYLIDDDHAQRY